MLFAICCVPVSPLRKEPSHKTEMVSQQLFGELCSIIIREEKWIKVRCKYDNYEGWCQSGHLIEIDESLYNSDNNMLTPEPFNKMRFNGSEMTLPIGCSLPNLQDGSVQWGNNKIEYRGALWDKRNVSIKPSIIESIAPKFLNTSYLWGGKSIYGIDCSGFTQTVFKFLNIPLLRDASLQATQGEDIGFSQLIKTGDLAFFENDEGNITHVGILLNDHQIIHSSERVRIDIINEKGIINSDTNLPTHKLRMLKRYF
jgi:gamma-D-glutamyl-L-lysine dipeptidyl-peptidase